MSTSIKLSQEDSQPEQFQCNFKTNYSQDRSSANICKSLEQFARKTICKNNLCAKIFITILIIALTSAFFIYKENDLNKKLQNFTKQVSISSVQDQKKYLIFQIESMKKQNKKLIDFFASQKQKKDRSIDTKSIQKAEIQTSRQNKAVQIYSSRGPAQQYIKAPVQEQFDVPKFVWVYLQGDINKENYIIQRGWENIKWYSKKSGFELRVVNSHNFDYWLKGEGLSQLDDDLRRIQNIKTSRLSKISSYQKIREQIIMLHLLKRYGGVIMNYKCIFTETLEWLRHIKYNVNINRGNPDTPPRYFAFYNINDGPHIEKENKKASVDAERLMVKFPGLTDFFLAGLPNGYFLKDVLRQMIDLVYMKSSEFQALLKNYGVNQGKVRVDDYYYTYMLSVHLVMFKKQEYLDGTVNSGYRQFALDYYGLYTMNTFYFPEKMSFFYKNPYKLYDNYFNHIARLPQTQFEDFIGPMRYIAFPDPFYQFNDRLEKARDQQGYEVLERSFIHNQLFMDKEYAFIKPNKEKPTVHQQFKTWDNLPKIIWLYWDIGIQNASVGNHLCISNMMKNAKAAGYEVRLVNDENFHEHLPQSELDRIKDSFARASFNLRPQTPSDFYRLALITHHGGIYLDASYFFSQSFDWITNIAKQPTQRIFNRFGEVPKVLQQFHALQGAPFNFHFDEKFNTKVAWHLALQSNFIAADKGSEYIREWYEMLHFFLTNRYSITQQKMKQCNTNSHRWTEYNNRYLIVMDSLKAVIGCRQKDIDEHPQKYGQVKSAHQYYGIWSFNGFNGFQKYRHYTNYDNNYGQTVFNTDASHMYRFSKIYNDAILGPVYKGVKMYSWNLIYLNRFIDSNYKHLDKETHPDSYFSLYLYDPTEKYIQMQGKKLHVQNIS